MRKATKIVISFAVILIAGLNIIVPAIAQEPFTAIAVGGLTGSSGAGLFGSMASMSGINIGWTGATADPMDAMWNVLNPDHVYFSGEKHEASGVGEDVWDYITVDIGDWLDAQSDFIVNFAQTNNVTDNSSGSIANFPRYYAYPFTHGEYGDTLGYAFSGGTYQYGPITFHIGNSAGSEGLYFYDIQSPTYTRSSWTNFGVNFIGSPIVLSKNNNNGNIYLGYVYNGVLTNVFNVDNGFTPAQTINWTSETVDTHVFDGWESAKVKIPSNISQLQTGWTLTDFLNELDRIWTGAGEDNIVIENGNDDPPVPPPVPIPSTPVGEVPFNDWVDLWGTTVTEKQEETNNKLDFIGSNGEDQLEELQTVNNNLQETNDTLENIDTNVSDIADNVENIDTNIDTMADDVSNIDTNVADIADHVENIDTNVEDIEDLAGSIDTNIGIGNGLLGDIKSLLQSAVDWLENIAENVAELVESVVQATETLIAGILNQIPTVFGVIFSPIKQASSIWHYVVEWIQSISAPMSWIWTMASGTSYNIILPVYASLAGAVVLAFYKRFGK